MPAHIPLASHIKVQSKRLLGLSSVQTGPGSLPAFIALVITHSPNDPSTAGGKWPSAFTAPVPSSIGSSGIAIVFSFFVANTAMCYFFVYTPRFVVFRSSSLCRGEDNLSATDPFI